MNDRLMQPGRASSTLAWWSGTVGKFRQQEIDVLVGRLSFKAIEAHRTNDIQQLEAWKWEIRILQRAVAALPDDWLLLLEYPLIRLGRRLDAVLVTDRAVLVIEFKALNQTFSRDARVQAEDYALDLRDFHAGSRNHLIVPIVVAGSGHPTRPQWEFPWPGVSVVYDALPNGLPELLEKILERIPHRDVDLKNWEQAPYRPVPTIIEAARALYQKHNVTDIKAARADTHNLTRTTGAILEAISDAKQNNKFTIVFVTGIPGAGKTLCGLDAVFSANTDACFLTGTLPMVYVLNAALAIDSTKGGKSKSTAERETKSKIQSITGFLRNYILKEHDLPEHVIVFDEAQRAWDEKHGANSPFKLTNSEAAIVLDIMHRHEDYAVIVGLIGNGQEINTGEAGLAEWGRALSDRPDWQIRAAPGVLNPENEPRQRLFPERPPGMIIDDCLHLDLPIRNVISPSAALWVDAMLRGRSNEARSHAGENLPFFITRSLDEMRRALRSMARGERRTGLVCSSGAKRLVADGIWPNFEHMDKAKVANWFLKKWPDVRASDALEVPATEFACQGLELDYVGLCWGGDLIWKGGWLVRNFRGNKWEKRSQRDASDFQINTYRVLLTRARSDTIIWMPDGDSNDATRDPALFDQTADYLISCGARPLMIATADQEQHSDTLL
jgi:hypothetical protein